MIERIEFYRCAKCHLIHFADSADFDAHRLFWTRLETLEFEEVDAVSHGAKGKTGEYTMNLTEQEPKTEAKIYGGPAPRMTATDEFIETNNLTLNRTQEEIKARMKEGQESFMDFSVEVFIFYLSFDAVKDLLKPEAITKYESGEEKWEYITSIHETAQDFLDYMNFAWGKALDERGISASRSVQKLSAWLWLMGRGDLADKIQDDRLYNPYGAPALIAICDAMQIPVPSELREFAKYKC